MRIYLIIAIFILMLSSSAGIGFSEVAESSIAAQKDVQIGPNYIAVPYGRILLIRNGEQYGGIRYLEFWRDKKGKKRYARYESFYQGDGTGDFSKNSVQHIKGEVSNKGLGNFLGTHYWKGDFDLKCGPIKLMWGGGEKRAGACFFGASQEQGDYGIELAPTPWKDISQINVFDSRIKWYRYDETRPDTYIPIDELWH
jgi:hypothetical protein